MVEKLAALKAGDSFDFSYNRHPKCPHCGEDYDIRYGDAWHLYSEDGPHDVDCPRCGHEFQVSSSASWTFSTDEQEEA